MSISRLDLRFFRRTYLVGQNLLIILTDEKSFEPTPPLGQVFVRVHRRRAKFHGLTRKNCVDVGRGTNFSRVT